MFYNTQSPPWRTGFVQTEWISKGYFPLQRAGPLPALIYNQRRSGPHKGSQSLQNHRRQSEQKTPMPASLQISGHILSRCKLLQLHSSWGNSCSFHQLRAWPIALPGKRKYSSQVCCSALMVSSVLLAPQETQQLKNVQLIIWSQRCICAMRRARQCSAIPYNWELNELH